MKVLGVIPARLGSERLREKPLRDISGKTLVQRVWEQVGQASSISKTVVATDAEEIKKVVEDFGGEVVMTDKKLQSGSERVSAVYELLKDEAWDIIVNIQGDMPFIHPELINNTVAYLAERPELLAATAATPITSEEEFLSPNEVKVVLGKDNNALYFSRSPVPHSRDGKRYKNCFGYRHFGIYVFRPQGLELFAPGAERSELEDIEKLEQLRALAMGVKIGVYVADPELTKGAIEVDTEADLLAAQKQSS